MPNHTTKRVTACPPQFLGRKVRPTEFAVRKKLLKHDSFIVGESMNKQSWRVRPIGWKWIITIDKKFVEFIDD